MDHIAEQRRVNQVYSQEITKSPDVHQAHTSQPPGLVVELVVEYLESNRVPFHRTLHRTRQLEGFSRPKCESTCTLLLMSYISRSWRDAAQRHLRRRVYINSQDVLRRVFQSPNLGPWVRGLSFSAHEFELYYTETFPGSMMAIDEMPRLLSGILKRCPNITHLYLYNFVGPAEEEANVDHEGGGKELESAHNSRPDVIRQLGEMEYLEHLWLHPTSDLTPELWKLCAVLPRLRNLKSLSLDHWNSRLPPQNADLLVGSSGFQKDKCPPPSLTHISLGRINIIDSEPIAWIMSSQSGYSCTSLQLCLNNMFQGHSSAPWMFTAPSILKDFQPLFRQIKLTITKLQLVSHQSRDDILSVMEIFPSLRSLSVVGGWTIPVQLALPSSLCAFHYHYTRMSRSSFSQEDDTRCLAILEASPSIRKMCISYSADRTSIWGNPPPVTSLSCPIIFADTLEYCARSNVKFSVIEEECIPNFLDFA